MKVLLVNPSCLDPRVTDDDATVVPIGLYYLAAQLLDKGITTGILNLAGHPGPPGEDPKPERGLATFEAALVQEKPDLIGFSVTNPSRFSAMACAQKAKELLPGVTVVFGGPAPTFMAAHLFEACPALDLAVRGEGDISFPALVASVAAGKNDLSSIKGLVFRTPAGLTDTGLPDPVQDLDRLARPSDYFTFQHLAMSRGCPGRCTFCGSPRFWGTSRVRRHSVKWFFQEMAALYRKGVTHFFISDDTFTQDREAVLRLCEKLSASGMALTWNAISRVDYVDAELLTAMRKAGCIQISYGVESGSPAIRKALGKPMDDETCVRAFDLTRSRGIMPRAYFIYGSPGETGRTIDQSISLMKRLKPLSTVFYLLVVFPGTHLYTRARDRHLVTDAVWHRKIEDLPWFELDPDLDFPRVKALGDRLRQAFFSSLDEFTLSLELVDDPSLAPWHADFLSRLAMTFSLGEYGRDDRVSNASGIARRLFERALHYAPDPRAYLGLGTLLQQDRDFARARNLLQEGLAHFPGHRDLSVGLGVCFMNLGRFDKALDCFAPFDNDPGLGQYVEICNTNLTR